MKLTKLITIIFLLCAPQMAPAASWQWIAPQRVHSLLQEGSGLWLVDVRIPSAFDIGHIEGAVNIPTDLVRVRNLPKTKIIVLADDSLGLRNARRSAEALQKRGYEKVFILEGGIPAWQHEGLPNTGMGDDVRPVTWDDLTWARKNSVLLRIYDLRDKEERHKGPVEGAKELAGSTLDDRLKAVAAEFQGAKKKGLAGKLDKPATAVLVLPSSAQPLEAVRRVLRGLPGDFRYLEGAYPLWVAREKEKPLPGPEVCPTCPGGRMKQ